eukprot:804656-Amphidinium_carterae.1
MPMEGLVWTTLMGRELLQDVMHPDALPNYQHPEGRVHALMFPVIYLLQQFLTTEGTAEEVWRPNYRDQSKSGINDSALAKYCEYVGVTSFRFLEFLEAFTSQMKKMLIVLKENMFTRLGLNPRDAAMRKFRAPNHPMWGTCLTVSLTRRGIHRVFVRLAMDDLYTNPVTGCRAILTDSSFGFMPGVIIAHAQMQGQEGVSEVTSATAVPEELLLEHDWWIRNEWKVEEARVMYEYLAQHTEAVTLMRGSALNPNARPEVISLKKQQRQWAMIATT